MALLARAAGVQHGHEVVRLGFLVWRAGVLFMSNRREA